MNRWLKKLEAMAIAVAFAEAGCWKTAEEIMKDADKSSRPPKRNASFPKPNKRPRMHT